MRKTYTDKQGDITRSDHSECVSPGLYLPVCRHDCLLPGLPDSLTAQNIHNC